MKAIRLALLTLLFVCFTSRAWCTWNELPVTGDAPVTTCGAYDSVWQTFWYGSATNKLYVVYNNGGVWTSKIIATDFNLFNNSVAVDSVNHWTYYTGLDHYIHVAYWTGSDWTSVKVGKNANDGLQLCVDSVWHVCFYVDSTGSLWEIHWDGSSWVENQVDQTTPRFRGNRSCGVDEQWHVVWSISSNEKKLIYTQWTGTAWTTGALTGAGLDLSSGSLFYTSLAVSSKSHFVYAVQTNMGNVPQQVSVAYYNGSAWVATPMFADGNLPAINSTNYVMCSPQDNTCYLGSVDTSNNNRCLFAGFFPTTARMWVSGRTDNATQGGGLGLFPLAVGLNGQAILCRGGNGTAKILMSDAP